MKKFKILLVTIFVGLMVVPAVPAQAHNTGYYPPELMEEYNGGGREGMCRAAYYATEKVNSAIGNAPQGRYCHSVLQPAVQEQHGWTCYRGFCKMSGVVELSTHVAYDTIYNYYYSRWPSQHPYMSRGGVYHTAAHEASHLYLYDVCNGDAGCGTGESHCYADYYAHLYLNSRPGKYSSYKNWCTNPNNSDYTYYWKQAYH